MKKGFTLVELMLVISIVSLISSIVTVGTTSAYQRGRDTQRVQQLHQIDLAVRQYESDNNGNAPTLGNTCGAGALAGYADTSSCIAMSTMPDTTPQGAAWVKFKEDISRYLPSEPKNPCGNNCAVDAGYVYVAPAVLSNLCALNPGSCTVPTQSFNESYTLTVPLEGAVTGGGGGGSGGGSSTYQALANVPIIIGIQSEVAPGGTAWISGRNFSLTSNEITFSLNGTVQGYVTGVSSNGSYLTFLVPLLSPQTYLVKIRVNGTIYSNSVQIKVTSSPNPPPDSICQRKPNLCFMQYLTF